MMGTRNLWDKLSSKRNYSSFVGNKVKKYDIDFKIKYISGAYRGPKRIDFRMDKKDWDLIVGDLKRLEEE